VLSWLRSWVRTKKGFALPVIDPGIPEFPVELGGVDALHAAFLKESRTRRCWVGQRTGNSGIAAPSAAPKPGAPVELVAKLAVGFDGRLWTQPQEMVLFGRWSGFKQGFHVFF
jgi:hypothetical protein